MYDENCEIARHFTYRENSRIFAHMSMVRAYDKTWMIQHHATRSMNGRRVGLDVLRDVTHYLLDMHRLPSANMEYLMCYFRPESEFPMRVFGGFAESEDSAQICSMDLFSYLTLKTPQSSVRGLGEDASLEKLSEEDTEDSRAFTIGSLVVCS